MLALDPTRRAVRRCRGARVQRAGHAPPSVPEGPGVAHAGPRRGRSGLRGDGLRRRADQRPHQPRPRAGCGTAAAAALGLEPLEPIERSTMPMALVTVFAPAASAEAVVKAMSGRRRRPRRRVRRLQLHVRRGHWARSRRRRTVVRTSATPGVPSSAPEVRVEMVAPRSRARGVAAAARAAHPYEEPLIVVADVEIARSSARMGMLCAAPRRTDPARSGGQCSGGVRHHPGGVGRPGTPTLARRHRDRLGGLARSATSWHQAPRRWSRARCAIMTP